MEYSILFGSQETPLKLGSKSIDCYVLENKMRVLSITSLQKALGYDGKFENWLFEFLNDINVYYPISTGILIAYENLYKAINPENNTDFIKTVDSINLIETCQVIIKAKNEGFLNASQIKFSKEALTILESVKNNTIEDLIDETTGYNIFKKNAIEKTAQNLKQQLNDNAYNWIKTFPDTFFETFFEMKNINWKELQYEQQKTGELLYELIFSRIDDQLLNELRLLNPKRTYKRKNGKNQDTQHPKLKEHLAILLSFAKVSGYNWNIFIQLLNKSFPESKKRTAKNIKIIENKQIKSQSLFNEKLKKSFIFKEK